MLHVDSLEFPSSSKKRQINPGLRFRGIGKVVHRYLNFALTPHSTHNSNSYAVINIYVLSCDEIDAGLYIIRP